jgi:hypothetical protein
MHNYGCVRLQFQLFFRNSHEVVMVLDVSKYALQQEVFYILCEVSTRECSEKIKKKFSHRNTI